MLKARRTSDGIAVEQFSTGPFIYLDQWLWAELAAHASVRSKAIAVFQTIKPTIMYSTITFYEMLRITDSRQLDNISEVMNSCDFMLIVANPTLVLKKELEHPGAPSGALNIHTIADNDLVRSLLMDLDDEDYSNISGASVLKVAMMSENATAIRKLRTAFANTLNPVIDKARETPAVHNSINMRKRSLDSQTHRYPCTPVVYQRAIDFIVANRTMKMPEREWIDVVHTVVPVSYADYVAIDKRWHHFVTSDSVLKNCKIAKTYSQASLDEFFTDIHSNQAL